MKETHSPGRPFLGLFTILSLLALFLSLVPGSYAARASRVASTTLNQLNGIPGGSAGSATAFAPPAQPGLAAATKQVPLCLDDPLSMQGLPPAGALGSWGESPFAASAPAYPAAAGPIPDIKVEGRPNDSGWVSIEADEQGSLYLAFEYLYTTGGDCPAEGCYALVAGKSRDNGRSWDLRYVVAATVESAESARRPSLTVDANGQLYIAFEYYYDAGGGSRWYPAVAMSDCPREVAAWHITAWNTTYALTPWGTAADAGGDGDDVYLAFVVAHSDDGHGDPFFAWSTDGGGEWTTDFAPTTYEYDYQWPTLSVGSANVVTSYSYTLNWLRNVHSGPIGASPYQTHLTQIQGSSTRPIYADAAGSGDYHYLVYERWTDKGHTYILYSTDDGSNFSGEIAVDAQDSYQRRPAVAASGANVRAVYLNGTGQTYLRTSTDNGQTWSEAYDMGGTTTVAGNHYLGVAYHPVGGAAAGKHPIAVWVDGRDAGSEGSNLYLGTINDPPTAGELSAPADGAAITAFAPTLSWTAGSDPDGDALRYWWFVSADNPPDEDDKVGGPVDMLFSLPYYTDRQTTYYWQVRTDDGYQVADTAVRSFTTESEELAGSPLNYTEGFAGEPAQWTRKAYACLDCFEDGWTRWWDNTGGRWEFVAYEDRDAVHVPYDAGGVDDWLGSPALDLRGSDWAYFNGYLRGSSESDHDILSMEHRPDDAAACWTVADARSGDYDGGWSTYYQGSVDLGAYAHTASAEVRLRFTTDESNHGGDYGVGWYGDDLEVARESLWSNAGGYESLQTTEGSFVGYTDNLVDQFYSPYLLLPDNAGQSIRLVLRERYEINGGDDEATVWIHDAGEGTWEQLAAYSGTAADFTERTIEIPDGYKDEVVVVALVLRTGESYKLRGPEGAGGYWDVDEFRLEEYAPTAVKLVRFAAVPKSIFVSLEWETASEHDNAGFNLYRGTTLDSPGVQLNELLIPSKGPGGDQGFCYDFLDDTALPGVAYYYTLEDVDLNGTRTAHGPVAITLWRGYLPLVGR